MGNFCKPNGRLVTEQVFFFQLLLNQSLRERMADFFQNGSITTLQNLIHRPLFEIENELR